LESLIQLAQENRRGEEVLNIIGYKKRGTFPGGEGKFAKEKGKQVGGLRKQLLGFSKCLRHG